MKRKTYKIEDEKRILIFEEEYDSNGNVIYFKDYQADPVHEKRTKYNSQGHIDIEIELLDGVEADRFVVSYDDNGEAIEQKHYISEELYEKIITDKNGSSTIRTTYQDGVETEKLAHEDLGNQSYVNKFYEEGELSQMQNYEYDQSEKIGVKSMFDHENNLLAIHKEQYDEQDRLIEFKAFNENENLIEEFITEYQGELITKEIHRQFGYSSFEHIITYEYDKNGNQTKREVHSPQGNLLEFHHAEYDNQNKMIAERGYSLGSFNAIYGTYFNHTGFEIEHDYE